MFLTNIYYKILNYFKNRNVNDSDYYRRGMNMSPSWKIAVLFSLATSLLVVIFFYYIFSFQLNPWYLGREEASIIPTVVVDLESMKKVLKFYGDKKDIFYNLLENQPIRIDPSL